MLHKLEAAASWCAEEGADEVRDLQGYEEEFADALALPPIRRDKLVRAIRVVGPLHV